MKKILCILLPVFAFQFSQVSGQGTNTPNCSGGVPGATVLTPSTTCTYSAGTTVGQSYQTNAANAGTPSCASPGTPDVFFQFTAPASGNVTVDLNAGTMTDSGMEIYSGSCGAWTSIGCDDDGGGGLMSGLTLGSLTPGQTYLIRVWSYSSGEGTFTICVQDNSGGSTPSNDDPCSATPISVGASCTFTAYTNAGATASSGVPAPGCANYSGGDVWFSVTVPASGNITFDSNTGVVLDGGMAVYSGTCGSLTLIDCNDDASTNGAMPLLNISGQTPGATLWVRFWEYGNNNNGTFELCAYDGTIGCPPPANDNPCSATVLPVNATCTYSTYTNACATASSGVPAPGCANYSGGDVWFQATVPASGSLVFNSNTGVVTDGGMAIYSGTCASLTLIACDDDGSVNGSMPQISNSSLVPGSTVWIRFWEYGNDNTGTFQLCAQQMPPPAANQVCNGMTPICSDTPITFTASTGGTPASTANPGNNYGCLSTSPNPSWYYIQLQTGGTISINMSAGSDIDFALWGPFTNLATAQTNCNTLGAPIDCSYSISATEQANATGAVAGQVYILLVTNYANVTQVIDLNSAAGNTALTDCSIILPIELTSLSARADYAANVINWSTQSELSNDGFYIERSYDGTNFQSIGFEDGSVNSSEEQEYSFTDRDYVRNLCYYRLKQIDLDGTVQYSSIVSVNRETDVVRLYPNPTNSSVTLEFPKNQTGNFVVKFRDSMGKEFTETIEISEETASYSSEIFETFPAGIYYLEISDENGNLVSVQKVIKVK